MMVVGIGLWAASLRSFDMGRINDLGLISLAPPPMLFGIALIALAFVLTVRLSSPSSGLTALSLLLLLVAVHGLPAFVEEAPRGAVAYLHAGFTDEIARTGRLLPEVDARFSWPVFFSLGALVTSIADVGSAIEFQRWAALASNLVYAVPLFVIFRSLSSDRRLIFTAIFMFLATNWIGQDYYSPQGFNYLLYLTVLAILLRWFHLRELPRRLARIGFIARRSSSDAAVLEREAGQGNAIQSLVPVTPGQRTALVAIVVLIMVVSVASHQLTPFALLAAIVSLTLLRRLSLGGLPVLLAVLIGIWISYMTVTFLAGNLPGLLKAIGDAGQSASQNVTSRLVGSEGHLLVVRFRLVMTLALWILAVAGAVRRFRAGHLDVEAIALAVIPFGLLLLQAYGGEMLLRVYLFALPFMAFLAAGLFFPSAERPLTRSGTRALALTATLLAVALMVTKHGNERADYVSADELSTVNRMYATAPAGSTIGMVNGASPVGFRRFEQFDYVFVDEAFLKGDVDGVVATLNPGDGCAFLLLSRTQMATAEMYAGVSEEDWDHDVERLLASGRVSIRYESRDATILALRPQPPACDMS